MAFRQRTGSRQPVDPFGMVVAEQPAIVLMSFRLSERAAVPFKSQPRRPRGCVLVVDVWFVARARREATDDLSS